MSDDVTNISPIRPTDEVTATPPVEPPTRDPAGTAIAGRAATPDSTAVVGRPPGNAPVGVVSVPGYEVRGEIARGGMGRVLAAYDLAFGREVAIKVVLAGPNAATTAGRFVRESRITGRLTHPNIPPAYQLGELADGSPFLAMKLVRGRTLAALLAERADQAHDLPRFVGIFEQVCQAVGYAHSQGVIHRDIKPANVMVGAFGEVQVMDWGLARDTRAGGPDPESADEADPSPRAWTATGSTVGDDRTQAGAVMGTPAYMAPEQARGEELDARVDVFALGGLLTSILVGRAPFWSGDVNSTMVLAASGDTSEVVAALDGCTADPELVGLARRCLAPTRADRPADGTAVAALAAAYRVGVEERLRAAERDRAAAEARATEQRKRRRVQLVLAAAVVLLVAGAGGVAVWRVREVGQRREDELQQTAFRDSVERDRKDTAFRAQVDADRRAEGERARQARAADGVANLLDQAEAALRAGDADRAAPFLDQAARRAADDAVADHAERLAAYRRDLDMLRALDRVNNFRWTPINFNLPPDAKVVEQWAAAFAGYGIVPGTTPPAEAVARVAGSPLKDSLLSALDGWLARVPSEPVRAILAAADPDPFRDEVRRLLAAGDRDRLAGLAGRAEWAAQPPGLVRAYALSRAVSAAVARGLLTRVVQVRPSDFGLLVELALTYPINTAEGAADRVRWIQAALALRPRNVAAINSLGLALLDKKEPDGAAAAFREAIRLDPTNPLPQSNLGSALRDKRDFDGAAAAYREAIRVDPTYPLPHNGLGNTLLDKKDLDGAVAAYREAIRLDPTFARSHNGLGNALRDKRDLDGAAAAYREAIRLDPMSAFPHNGLGNVLWGKKDLDGAATAYREAIRLDPTYPLPHNGLGNVLQDKEDPDGAAAAFREAIRLDPTNPLPHNGLGVVLRDKRDFDGAAVAFRGAIRLDPTNPLPHNGLGVVLRDKRDFDGAAAAFRGAIRLDPGNASYHNSLGVTFELMLELAEAEGAYREAVRLNPRFSVSHANLGDVYRKQGRHADAIAAYRAALAVQPTLGFAREGLAYCLRVQRGEVPTAPPPRAVAR